MYSVELYARVRRACHVDGLSERAAARLFGIDRKTVSKILKHSVPPGYRRSKPPARPKLDPFIPIIDQILGADRALPKKQRHTAQRIFERLRDEHWFSGGITIVTDYVREKKRRTQEVFVPLAHPPGHAQVDFGEAFGEIGGVRCKLHYFAMALPYSDAFFIKAYPAETAEAFCDGHVSAFAFFGGVPLSILFDNTTLAVAKILGDGTRKRTITFSELQSHYLFEDRFGRPGKGNDKGNLEGVIGFGRRNFLVPMPRFESFDALNDWLEEQCLKRQDAASTQAAVVVSRWRTNSDTGSCYRRDGRERMVDVALSTAAAPTIFEAVERDGYTFVDGGIWANNPVMIGVTDTLTCYAIERRQLHVLSLGTGRTRIRTTQALRTDGKHLWARHFVDAAMAAQSHNALGQAYLLLGKDHVIRLDAPETTEPVALDDVRRAIRELPGIANVMMETAGDRVAAMFLQ